MLATIIVIGFLLLLIVFKITKGILKLILILIVLGVIIGTWAATNDTQIITQSADKI